MRRAEKSQDASRDSVTAICVAESLEASMCFGVLTGTTDGLLSELLLDLRGEKRETA